MSAALLLLLAAAPAAPLKVGVTMHPYYSWTANIVKGTGVEVRPVLPPNIDVGNYQPRPEDVKKLADLDALVVNGIGHDDFIFGMLKASGNTHCVVIKPNATTALMKSAHGEGVNSHTFLSFTNAIQQSYVIARALGQLRPKWNDTFQQNAHAYAKRLRAMKADAIRRLADANQTRVITVHDGYSYLLSELGLELVDVVQPAHGLTPSAKELAAVVKEVASEKVKVVLSEEAFPQALLKPLEEKGAHVTLISHISVGPFTPERFETEMQANVDALVKALGGH